MSGEAFLLDITHGWGHFTLHQFNWLSPTEISVVQGKRFLCMSTMVTLVEVLP